MWHKKGTALRVLKKQQRVPYRRFLGNDEQVSGFIISGKE
jgi:hypothetical protein